MDSTGPTTMTTFIVAALAAGGMALRAPSATSRAASTLRRRLPLRLDARWAPLRTNRNVLPPHCRNAAHSGTATVGWSTHGRKQAGACRWSDTGEPARTPAWGRRSWDAPGLGRGVRRPVVCPRPNRRGHTSREPYVHRTDVPWRHVPPCATAGDRGARQPMRYGTDDGSREAGTLGDVSTEAAGADVGVDA